MGSKYREHLEDPDFCLDRAVAYADALTLPIDIVDSPEIMMQASNMFAQLSIAKSLRQLVEMKQPKTVNVTVSSNQDSTEALTRILGEHLGYRLYEDEE